MDEIAAFYIKESKNVHVCDLKKKFHNRKRMAAFALMPTTSGDLMTRGQSVLRPPHQALEVLPRRR